LEFKQAVLYDNACYQMGEVNGIRFAGIINKHGRKIAGGFSFKVTPLEQDEKKMEMLLMEIALDLSMRKEFDNSLGRIRAIVSYREKANIITIPHGDNLMLLSSEPEIDPLKVIQLAYDNLKSIETMEVLTH